AASRTRPCGLHASGALRRRSRTRPRLAAGRRSAGGRPAAGSRPQDRTLPLARSVSVAVVGWDGSSRPEGAEAPAARLLPAGPRAPGRARAALGTLDKFHRHLPVGLRTG